MAHPLQTPLTALLGIQYPLIQAPIGSASTPTLAAAVSNAGGLGMLAMSWRNPDEVQRVLQETQALTSKPFGVNFVLDTPILAARPLEERLQHCLDARVKLISLAWGSLPPAWAEHIHHAGSFVAYTVWTPQQAREAVAAGADIIVLQGTEAGGHLNTETPLFAALPAVVEAVAPIPVVAAGGLGNGLDIAAALNLGAQGAWLGTRFVASEEAWVHPEYKQRIVDANADDTIYHTLYTVGWPDAPHRTLKNSTSAKTYTDEKEVVTYFANGDPVYRYEDVIPLPGMTGNIEALAHYAGTSVAHIHDIAPAASIVAKLMTEAENALTV